MTDMELRAWREQRRLGLRELARSLEIQPSTLMRWEKGDRPMPGAWLTLALAALDCQRAAKSIDRDVPDDST